jgi:hypothetical protein
MLYILGQVNSPFSQVAYFYLSCLKHLSASPSEIF